MKTTIVHLLRHGKVDNPYDILYGMLPDFHLSAAGHRMAEVAASILAQRDVVHVASSPMDRAQETAQPLAEALTLPVKIDERLTEARNVFEGYRFDLGPYGALRRPSSWLKLWNPLRPSWGEPYSHIIRRMWAAVGDVRAIADGHEAVCISHQLPIWAIRRHVEGRRPWGDPRRRQCALASITSLKFADERVVSVEYSEPAGPTNPYVTPGA